MDSRHSDAIALVFQLACNEFMYHCRKNPGGIAKDNKFFKVTQAIQDVWPDVIEEYFP